MKKYFIFLICAALGAGCRTNNNATPEESFIPPLNEADFLKNETPIFQGNLGSDFVSWQGGSLGGMFAYGMGYAPRNGGTSRSVDFALYSRELDPQIRITTPLYQPAVKEDFERVFSVGKKVLGAYNDNFNLNVMLNRKNYSTTKDGGSSVEILKTVTATNQLGNKVLRVWFKIDATLYEQPSNANSIQIKNGLMTAEFVKYESE